jgi:hypothetical protein
LTPKDSNHPVTSFFNPRQCVASTPFFSSVPCSLFARVFVLPIFLGSFTLASAEAWPIWCTVRPTGVLSHTDHLGTCGKFASRSHLVAAPVSQPLMGYEAYHRELMGSVLHACFTGSISYVPPCVYRSKPPPRTANEQPRMLGSSDRMRAGPSVSS